jgi:hypothetical protein
MTKTVNKAARVTIAKALVSDFSVNPTRSLTSGNADVKAPVNTNANATAASQIPQEALGTADNIHPKLIYVTSNSSRETQGSLFEVNIL